MYVDRWIERFWDCVPHVNMFWHAKSACHIRSISYVKQRVRLVVLVYRASCSFNFDWLLGLRGVYGRSNNTACWCI
jgi:hypothetical protein